MSSGARGNFLVVGPNVRDGGGCLTPLLPGTEKLGSLSQPSDGAGHTHVTPHVLLCAQVLRWKPADSIPTQKHAVLSFPLTTAHA
eukprot:scaffold140912_cov15-Tisochrysis_lutea.AAC.1